MALQLGALRNALIEAGATQATADKAAEEVAGYEREFSSLHTEMERNRAEFALEFVSFRADVAREFSAVRSELGHESNSIRAEMAQGFAAARAERDDMRSDIKVLRWGQAVIVAGIVAILLKTSFH